MSVGPVVKRLRSEWHRPHRWAEMGQARLGKWSALPEGLVVADKPEKLDDALVGLLLFMRWPTPHGWQVGKITSKITPATPRLFKSFNYRCAPGATAGRTRCSVSTSTAAATRPSTTRGSSSRKPRPCERRRAAAEALPRLLAQHAAACDP